jgi:DNA-binding sugar fermentation-stimulating protein
MQIEYNQKEQLAEISINVFSDDLERALTRRSGKSVRLDKSPDAARLVLAYLNESVNLKNTDGQIQGLTWVGMEPKADAVWLYVETKMPSGFVGMEVRNRLFFDLFDDQVNRVHIKYEDMKYDLVFKPGDEFKPFKSTSPK